jgi:hypothetical protein
MIDGLEELRRELRSAVRVEARKGLSPDMIRAHFLMKGDFAIAQQLSRIADEMEVLNHRLEVVGYQDHFAGHERGNRENQK